MDTDKATLIIHRVMSEWVKIHNHIEIPLSDYLELIDVLIAAYMQQPDVTTLVTPLVPMQKAVNKVFYCEICEKNVRGNAHMWIKHKIRKNTPEG